MKKFIVAIAAFAMMTGSAFAADWAFYGDARVDTFYSSTDVINGANGETNIAESLMGTSRVGANVTVSDELVGNFEFRAVDGDITLRRLFGEWNFGAGKLLVGQEWTPCNIAYSSQVYGDDGMGDTGDVTSLRAPMIQLTFGDFKIAAVSPDTTAIIPGATQEVDLPTIEVKYSHAFDNITLDLAAGYNTYKETTGGVEYDIDSYVIGAGVKATFGAVMLAGNIMFGQNAGNIIGVDTDLDGLTAATNTNDGYATWNGTQVFDTDVTGYQLVAAYTVNDMFRLEAGYGYVEADSDDATIADDEAANYYVQAAITLAPGVTVTPEIGVYDYEENNDGEITYYGAKWQINF
ncbi:MAG: hypothetical protein HUN04_24140 [Desulfobacter sp.]|nr:MAG: hypothetical protein HUN04_24140 [Desulfobacter sp.]